MAFTDLGSLGATGSTANNQGSLALTTAAACAVGELVVVVVAVDNPGNGGDGGVSAVQNSGTANTWTKAIQIQNAVAAQGGASCSIWYTVVTTAISSGATITATFQDANASDASGLTARHFSMAAGNTVAIEGTPGTLLGNTAADPGSLNVTTANIACLRIRGIASQVGNNTSLTPTSTWTAWANGNSATTGTTGEMCARAESLISTATGAASDPTYVSAIYASAYVAFKETVQVTNVTVNPTGVAGTGGTTAPSIVGKANVGVEGVFATGSVGTVTAGIFATTIPTGQQATGSVGTVDVVAKQYVSYVPTGQLGTGAVGDPTITAKQNVTTIVAGQFATGSVGIPTIVAKQNISYVPTGQFATGFVGIPSISVGGATIVNVSGLSATASVGNVTTVGKANVSVTGLGAAASVGNVGIATEANVLVTGLVGTTAVGVPNILVSGGVSFSVTGLQATASVGSINVTLPQTIHVTGLTAIGQVDIVNVIATSSVVVEPSNESGQGLVGNVTINAINIPDTPPHEKRIAHAVAENRTVSMTSEVRMTNAGPKENRYAKVPVAIPNTSTFAFKQAA